MGETGSESYLVSHQRHRCLLGFLGVAPNCCNRIGVNKILNSVEVVRSATKTVPASHSLCCPLFIGRFVSFGLRVYSKIWKRERKRLRYWASNSSREIYASHKGWVVDFGTPWGNVIRPQAHPPEILDKWQPWRTVMNGLRFFSPMTQYPLHFNIKSRLLIGKNR